MQVTTELVDKVRSQIGDTEKPVSGVIDSMMSRRYARAIGETDPLYLDEDYAKARGFAGLVVPPNFLPSYLDWTDGGPENELRPDGTPLNEMKWLPSEGLRIMGGGEEMVFHAPLIAGTEDADEQFAGRRVTRVQRGPHDHPENSKRVHSRRRDAADDCYEDGAWTMSVDAGPTQRNVDTLDVGDQLEPMVKRPTEVQLFRYCAVSWNSHRIHYDLEYAKSEGYPNVLVQSHLHGAFFSSFCFDWAGLNGRVDRLAYSVRRFATPGDDLTLEGTIVALEEVDGGTKATLELREMRHSDDTVCAIADADVFFPRSVLSTGDPDMETGRGRRDDDDI